MKEKKFEGTSECAFQKEGKCGNSGLVCLLYEEGFCPDWKFRGEESA